MDVRIADERTSILEHDSSQTPNFLSDEYIANALECVDGMRLLATQQYDYMRADAHASVTIVAQQRARRWDATYQTLLALLDAGRESND